MNPFKLWNFHGGVMLERHKQESTRLPLAIAPLPERLIFPLHQRGGHNAQALVSPGDRVLKGQVIARDDEHGNPPLHASSSGLVTAIEPRPLPHPSGLADLCIVIATDGDDAEIEYAEYNSEKNDYRRCTPEALRRCIHEAGIVGLGGAGFPTALKIAPDRRVDTLILNGAECEPYITCDDSLLRQHTHEVLEGGRILRHILGAERVLLALEHDRPEAIAAVEQALRDSDFQDIALVRVPAIYPTGGERQLIRVLTGREVPSRGLPAEVGVICQNVGTAAAVQAAVTRNTPLLSRIVTVTGRGVRQPQNLLARIGTPIADLVAHCGGYTDEAERLILGGPMMGFSLSSDNVPLIKSSNCILVAGRGEFGGVGGANPCIRCGACAEVCPANLLPQQLYWHGRADQVDRLLEYHLFDCIECGCCDVVCPSHLPLTQHFRAAKSHTVARQREREKAEQARARFEARTARKEQEKREQAEATHRKKASLDKAAEIQRVIERAKQKRAEKSAAQAATPPMSDTPTTTE